MKLIFIFLLTFLMPTANAGSRANQEACRLLCESESDCLRQCVDHTKLMELHAELVNAASSFDKMPEVRLRALRTGATVEVFDICSKIGWSTENKLICLRSYPTKESVKTCKKLSSREEDQVRCVRNAKISGEARAQSRKLALN